MKTNPRGTPAPGVSSQETGKWIELIRVRSSPATLEAAMPSVESQVADLEASADGAETHLLRHACYDGDLAVVLIWRGTETKPMATREGTLVADRLRRIGSVDHAVWVPAEEQPF